MSLTKQQIIHIMSTFLPEVTCNMNTLMHPTQEFMEQFCIAVIAFIRNTEEVHSLINVQRNQCTSHGSLDKGIVLSNICKQFNAVALKARMEPLGLRDILFPCPKKTLKILKHVLNYLLFYAKFGEDTQNLFLQLDAKKQENIDMANKNVALEQQCVATEKECEEIENGLMQLRAESVQVESNLENATKTFNTLNKKMESLNAEEKSLSVAIAASRESIVQLEEDKICAANGVVEDFPTVEKKLERLKEKLQSYVNKYKECQKKCYDLKDGKTTLTDIVKHFETMTALKDKLHSVLKVAKVEAEKVSICDTETICLEKKMSERLESLNKDEETLLKVQQEQVNLKNEIENVEATFAEEMNSIKTLITNKTNEKVSSFKQYQDYINTLKYREMQLQEKMENYNYIVAKMEQDEPYIKMIEKYKKAFFKQEKY